MAYIILCVPSMASHFQVPFLLLVRLPLSGSIQLPSRFDNAIILLSVMVEWWTAIESLRVRAIFGFGFPWCVSLRTHSIVYQISWKLRCLCCDVKRHHGRILHDMTAKFGTDIHVGFNEEWHAIGAWIICYQFKLQSVLIIIRFNVW